VRVLRIIEYTGPREWVEDELSTSIHGTKVINNREHGRCYIRVATIGEYPEILAQNWKEVEEGAKTKEGDSSKDTEGVASKR
jgi:hypothetical protein